MDALTSNNTMNPRQSKALKIAKNGGLRARANAKCYDCIYDELAPGTWKKQVENCTMSDCSLHAVRPSSKKAIKSKLIKN